MAKVLAMTGFHFSVYFALLIGLVGEAVDPRECCKMMSYFSFYSTIAVVGRG